MTGIWGFNEQDRSVQESMGSTVDRSREHLGRADIAIIGARRLLIKLARDLQSLIPLYKIRSVQPVDLFPHTAHVETLALLERKPC